MIHLFGNMGVLKRIERVHMSQNTILILVVLIIL